MSSLAERRLARRHHRAAVGNEGRTEFQRDRDRLLYSAYLRRLAHITQVVSPAEGYAFHNRLTHVLKVAQVGRRLTEKLIRQTPSDILARLGGLDADVVEAAALAHDLGHPPFGHIAEHELDALARKSGLRDGYEGNAQSFRIVTKLEVREVDQLGLNLSRATLNAILKYPCICKTIKRPEKPWGAYASEKADFDFARQKTAFPNRQSLEANIMDWADDIAYSVHDLEDFYRAGRVPLDRLAMSREERDRFLGGVFRRKKLTAAKEQETYQKVWEAFYESFPAAPYAGTRLQKADLRFWASFEISKFEEGTIVTRDGLKIDPEIKIEVDLLKQLIWHYVIENPALAVQQHGQRRVIRELFEIYSTALEKRNLNIFPEMMRDELNDDHGGTRLILDLIAGYTEQQAIDVHSRLSSAVQGTAFKAL